MSPLDSLVDACPWLIYVAAVFRTRDISWNSMLPSRSLAKADWFWLDVSWFWNACLSFGELQLHRMHNIYISIIIYYIYIILYIYTYNLHQFATLLHFHVDSANFLPKVSRISAMYAPRGYVTQAVWHSPQPQLGATAWSRPGDASPPTTARLGPSGPLRPSGHSTPPASARVVTVTPRCELISSVGPVSPVAPVGSGRTLLQTLQPGHVNGRVGKVVWKTPEQAHKEIPQIKSPEIRLPGEGRLLQTAQTIQTTVVEPPPKVQSPSSSWPSMPAPQPDLAHLASVAAASLSDTSRTAKAPVEAVSIPLSQVAAAKLPSSDARWLMMFESFHIFFMFATIDQLA